MKKLLAAAAVTLGTLAAGGYGRITNDCFWTCADGTPIYSQGGGIFRFHDPVEGRERYFWYGARYREAAEYHRDPSVTLDENHFEAVTLYVSDSLTAWQAAPPVLVKDSILAHGPLGWVGRLGVARLDEAGGLYALLVQHNAGVLVATSESPYGPFAWSHEIDMTPVIGTPNTGDQTVFIDPDDGTPYLIYSYGRGRGRQYVSRIGMGADGKPGLMDCVEVCRGASREGNCMFKHRGKYYMVASNIYGWDGSLTYYVASDNIYGPYLPVNDMQVMDGTGADYSHVAQTGFFVTHCGSADTTVVYCGDRWAEFAGNGLGYNQWVPLSFRGDVPRFNSLHCWQLDHATGRWRVDPGNNWVLNGSFEADRRTVPLAVKPRQDELTGWTTEVLRGNRVSPDSVSSPQLNYFNTRADRGVVTGEKSLNISDTADFERRVSQTVAPRPWVELPAGSYTLGATVRASAGFVRLEMFAATATGGDGDGTPGAACSIDLTALVPADGRWHRVSLPGIAVDKGRVTVGFHASGTAGASCQVDDVTLILSDEN